MRKWSSVAACLAALAFAGAAGADTPPDVYSDFAEDGSLSCGHSRAALKGSDRRLDLPVRRSADVPRPQARGATAIGRELPSRATGSGGRRVASRWDLRRPAIRTSRVRAARSRRAKAEGRPPTTERSQEEEQAVRLDVPSSGGDGRMTLLGVVLLLLTLGSGWAARRAFTANP